MSAFGKILVCIEIVTRDEDQIEEFNLVSEYE